MLRAGSASGNEKAMQTQADLLLPTSMDSHLRGALLQRAAQRLDALVAQLVAAPVEFADGGVGLERVAEHCTPQGRGIVVAEAEERQQSGSGDGGMLASSMMVAVIATQ